MVASMTDFTPKMRLSPSSAGFMAGPLVDADGNGSCHRYVLANRVTGFRDRIDPLYGHIGGINEARQSAILEAANAPVRREVPFEVPLLGGEVKIEGRADFVIQDGPDTFVLETKGSVSTNQLKKIQAQEPKQSHIAQLATYLMAFKAPIGRVIWTFWEWNPAFTALEVAAEADFEVAVKDDGRITVNNQPYKFSAKDLSKWYTVAADYLVNWQTKLPPRPRRVEGSWTDPCKFCPLKHICDSGVKEPTAFYLQVSEVTPSEPREATIRSTPQPRGKKK
jgi:hypothetical protein